MTFDIKEFLMENKIALNEAPRDIHFKGARPSGPDFGDARKNIAIAAHKLAATVENTNDPGIVDRREVADVIRAMGKFRKEISTLERQWRQAWYLR